MQSILIIKVQNLRRTLTYHGKLEFLSFEEGNFSQIINLFIHQVSWDIFFIIVFQILVQTL